MKVFLVEDAANVRDLIMVTVQDAGGCVVGSAATQSGAIRGILESEPDLLIVDLWLAEGNGLDVIRESKKVFPEINVVVLTNNAKNQYESVCRIAGASHYFEKSAADFRSFEGLMKELNEVSCQDCKEVESEY